MSIKSFNLESNGVVDQYFVRNFCALRSDNLKRKYRNIGNLESVSFFMHTTG